MPYIAGVFKTLFIMSSCQYLCGLIHDTTRRRRCAGTTTSWNFSPPRWTAGRSPPNWPGSSTRCWTGRYRSSTSGPSLMGWAMCCSNTPSGATHRPPPPTSHAYTPSGGSTSSPVPTHTQPSGATLFQIRHDGIWALQPPPVQSLHSTTRYSVKS